MYKKLSKDQALEISDVLRRYNFDISKIDVYRNTIANNNRVLLVKNGKSKFILRESGNSKSPEHLKLEVNVLRYLNDEEFGLTPSIIPNSDDSLITISDTKYYILENFLPGDVKDEVNNLTKFNDGKLMSLFKALAKFTRTVEKFDAPVPKDNKPLYYYVRNGEKIFNGLLKKVKKDTTRDLLVSKADFVKKFIKETEKSLIKVKYDRLKKQIVHFDLHPGNVNYIKDNVTGIFDFDWVRFDNRITDLACTLGQSCYAYRGKSRALYNKRKLHLGLKSYRAAYGKSEFSIEKENQIIQAALRGYMLFQLLWIIEWSLNNLKDKDDNKHIRFSLDVLKLNDFDKLLV